MLTQAATKYTLANWSCWTGPLGHVCLLMPFGSSLIYITHNTACCEVETITMICAPAFVLISATYQVSVSLFLLVFRVCSMVSSRFKKPVLAIRFKDAQSRKHKVTSVIYLQSMFKICQISTAPRWPKKSNFKIKSTIKTQTSLTIAI